MTTRASASDRIASVRVSSCYLPLANPVSDAKVLTGRQKPMTEIAMLFAEIDTAKDMELHVHLAAAYALEPWVEPLFNERIEIKDDRMQAPTCPGLGLTLTDQARGWTRKQVSFGVAA